MPACYKDADSSPVCCTSDPSPSPRKAEGDGSRPHAPLPMREMGMEFQALGFSLDLSFSCCGHLASEPVYGKFLPLSLIFSLSLCNSIVQISKQITDLRNCLFLSVIIIFHQGLMPCRSQWGAQPVTSHSTLVQISGRYFLKSWTQTCA